MKKRFSEEQIAFSSGRQRTARLPERSAGRWASCENTFYRWKRKYEGLGVAELRRLKQLVADLALDREMLQDVIRKNSEACSEARGGPVPGPLLPGL